MYALLLLPLRFLSAPSQADLKWSGNAASAAAPAVTAPVPAVSAAAKLRAAIAAAGKPADSGAPVASVGDEMDDEPVESDDEPLGAEGAVDSFDLALAEAVADIHAKLDILGAALGRFLSKQSSSAPTSSPPT